MTLVRIAWVSVVITQVYPLHEFNARDNNVEIKVHNTMRAIMMDMAGKELAPGPDAAKSFDIEYRRFPCAREGQYKRSFFHAASSLSYRHQMLIYSGALFFAGHLPSLKELDARPTFTDQTRRLLDQHKQTVTCR
jgi:hypothetical protein